MPASVVVAPEVKIDGSALEARMRDSLVNLRVVHGLGVPAYARLSFQVGQHGGEVDSITTKLGDAVTIGCTSPGDQSVERWQIFDGLVVSLGVEFDEGMGALVVVEAYDKLYKLGRTSVATGYQDAKASDIISKLAAKAGLAAQVDATPVVWESRYQYGTDYAYLDGLVREIGYEWFVEDGKLHARKRPASSSPKPTFEYGKDLRSFKARFTAGEHAEKVEVRGWDIKKKEEIVGTATYPNQSATSPQIGLGAPTKADGGATAMSIPRAVRSLDHANQLAASIVDRRATEALRARGEVDPRPGVKPGAVLEIKGVGKNFSGDYYCTQVEHVFGGRNGSMRTLFEVGPSDPESLVDILGDGSAPTLDKMLGSFTIGIVTNNKDDEGLQRVKLKLPYLSDQLETGWARVLQPGAGADRGWTVIPEIDDEVLVGFEHGDIDHPYVLGGLVNNKDKQKYQTTDLVEDGKVVARIFNSRLGHEIRLSDGTKPEEQFVRISTPLDDKSKATAILLLGEKRIDLQAEGVPVKVFNEQGSIEITDKGDIALEAAGNITVKATKDVKIEGANVNIKGKQNIDVEAGIELGLTGLNSTLEAKAITTVKGAAMVKIN